MATKELWLKIWHRVKHDDFTVTELPVLDNTQISTIQSIRNNGGFWIASQQGWVPWHSISYIEWEEREGGAH